MKEVLKLALEALTNAIAVRNGEGGTKLVSPLEENAIAAIKEALAQDDLCSSQEPWMYRIWNDKDAQWRLTDDCSWPAEPIYTTPPQRPWVGLTAQEAADCWTTSATKTWHNFEAALRSKNI